MELYLERITRNEILEKVEEYDIFRYYLNYNFQLGEKLSSPFRRDRNPSFGIFKGRNGNLMFKDLSTGISGDCFKFAREILNLKGFELNKRIYKDLCVNTPKILQSTPEWLKTYKKGNKVISVKRKNFTDTDIRYWESFYIDKETLIKYKVYPIETFWIDGEISKYIYSKKEPMYAYKIYTKFKIYRPYSTDKWRTNCSTYDFQGMEQLPDNGDLLIITKSLKDVMVLYKLGYNAVAVQGETHKIPKVILKNLSNRFNKILLFYDNDKPGIEAANNTAKDTGLGTIFLPHNTAKDISDYVKAYGIDKGQEILTKII